MTFLKNYSFENSRRNLVYIFKNLSSLKESALEFVAEVSLKFWVKFQENSSRKYLEKSSMEPEEFHGKHFFEDNLKDKIAFLEFIFLQEFS